MELVVCLEEMASFLDDRPPLPLRDLRLNLVHRAIEPIVGRAYGRCALFRDSEHVARTSTRSFEMTPGITSRL
jgi:hypothetical protein